MKKLILGTVALSAVGLANGAFAADMPVKAPILAPIIYNWTGCYVGGNAGWKWGRFNESVDTAAGSGFITGVGPIFFPAGHVDLDHLETTSGAVGGQVGCRWENADHWVFGVEGDFDWTDLHGTVINTSPPTTALFPGDTFGNRMRWESSGRVTLGHSFDRLLVYGTGGLAVSRVTMDANFIPVVINGVPYPGAVGSDSKLLTGGTVGLGAAYALAKNWEIVAEYRYTFYSQAAYNLGTPAAFCAFTTAPLAPPGVPVCLNTTATGHKGLETQEVLLKLNYRFDWGGAVVAKY
jgi:outer membrane immunogenic protein